MDKGFLRPNTLKNCSIPLVAILIIMDKGFLRLFLVFGDHISFLVAILIIMDKGFLLKFLVTLTKI